MNTLSSLIKGALVNYPPFKVILGTVVLLTAIELINLFTGRALVTFGILPRTLNGLLGILFSPFIHGSISHFLSNLLPLCILMFLVSLQGMKRLLIISTLSILLTGIAVWSLAGTGYHVGASGLIYSYFGFLLVNGIVRKEFKYLVISIITFIGYGGLIFGVLPGQVGISWESHLLGFLVGGVIGYRAR